MYIPDQGDIVYLDFEPSVGKEIVKRRLAIVLSRLAFNRHTNLAIVAPITSKIRGMGLEVVLVKSMKTKGAVLIAQLKSIDFEARAMDFVEKAPAAIINEAKEKASVILS